MLKVGIIVGSTRPGRKAEEVARWVQDQAAVRTDAQFELVDIGAYALPLLDEPAPPSFGNYTKEHTRAWSATIETLDAFIFVTPEYNHSMSGALKNALDFLAFEWANKAAGFVSYGSAGGARAVEHLRGIMGELQVADVRSHVLLSLFDDFENFSSFRPRSLHTQNVTTLFDQVIGWGAALKLYRERLDQL